MTILVPVLPLYGRWTSGRIEKSERKSPVKVDRVLDLLYFLGPRGWNQNAKKITYKDCFSWLMWCVLESENTVFYMFKRIFG